MFDRYRRDISYLRLSVTGRCNLNCVYCKRDPAGRPDITIDEIKKLLPALTALGVKKIRLTGGEPLMRRDIAGIVSVCAAQEGIGEVTMTTNAILLPRYAAKLKAAGLRRVNISLNTLKPDTFRKISRFSHLEEVLKGINAAKEAGLIPIKINVVLMRGVNDTEIPAFLEMTRSDPVEVRFIEYMPMGREYDQSKVMPASEVLTAHPELLPVKNADGSSVADIYQGKGYAGKIGFITPVSCSFCDTCNRLRITHDMKLRMCLGSNEETDLTPVMEMDSAAARDFLAAAIQKKPKQGFSEGFATERGMGNIGG